MSNKLTSLAGFGEGDPKPEGKTIGSPSKSDKFKIVRKPGYKYSLESNSSKSSALHKKMGKKDKYPHEDRFARQEMRVLRGRRDVYKA